MDCPDGRAADLRLGTLVYEDWFGGEQCSVAYVCYEFSIFTLSLLHAYKTIEMST
jgi:hypothetical protein